MKLISELKIGARTTWLLSETLVVVLGVLIALGLNDYWTDRQERDLELQYLKRIHEDVSTDAKVISLWYGERLEEKLRALDVIAPIVRGEQPVPDDVEPFLRNVIIGGFGGTSSTTFVTSTTIEDLKSTGNLRLIRNVDLRSKIARYYHDMERLHIRSRDRRTGYTSFVSSQLPADFNDPLAYEMMTSFGTDRALERLTSVEFQDLFNQEYNLALFRKQITNQPSKQLATNLEAYIQQLGGSL